VVPAGALAMVVVNQRHSQFLLAVLLQWPPLFPLTCWLPPMLPVFNIALMPLHMLSGQTRKQLQIGSTGLNGEMDDKYEYRQEGNAPGIVFSALQCEEQKRERTLAPASPAALVAASVATGFVVTGNDAVDDEGGEGENDEMTGESSEVFLLTPRHIGATAGGVGGCIGGRGHQLPFHNCNQRLVLFPGNEVQPASVGPSLSVQALSAMCRDQGLFSNSEVASASGSHPESPSCADGSAQHLAYHQSLSLDTRDSLIHLVWRQMTHLPSCICCHLQRQILTSSPRMTWHKTYAPNIPSIEFANYAPK
jgi:hypothetical protein